MNTVISVRSAVALATASFCLATAGVAAAQTPSPSPSPSLKPVNVKARALRHKNTIPGAQEDLSVNNGGIKLQTGVNNAASQPQPHSGSDCIQTQTVQDTPQQHANTGAVAQDIVDVPLDGSATLQSASSKGRLAQACATTAP